MKTICGNSALSVIMLCNIASAQINVREEPHHKLLIENEYLRIYDGHIPFGDTTLVHTHSANSVVVFLSKSTFGIQNVGEKPARTEVRPGNIIYRSYGQNSVSHIVWNQSRPMLHFMVIELVKQSQDDDMCSDITQIGISLILMQKSVKVYNSVITKGKQYIIPNSNCAHLLINISGAFVVAYEDGRRELQANEFIFFAPQRDIKISGSNINNENSRFVLLELK